MSGSRSKINTFLRPAFKRNIQQRNGAKGLYHRGGSELIKGRPQSFNPFPQTMFAQHKYVEDFAFAADNLTGLMGSDYAFRLNSLYDPNFTGTGHQPQGFDQMTPLYGRYTVYKVRISIRLITASSGTACIGLSYRSSTNPNSFNLTSRFPGNVEESVNCLVIDASSPGQWESGDLYIADMEGVPRSTIFNDISYTGGVSSNPAICPYVSLAVGDWAQIPGATVRFSLTMQFFAQWSNAATLGPS